jgi:hypothetical protein
MLLYLLLSQNPTGHGHQVSSTTNINLGEEVFVIDFSHSLCYFFEKREKSEALFAEKGKVSVL